MEQQVQPQVIPPVKIAFVIDDKVVDVIHTDERMASILLSEPTIVDATEWMKEHPGELLLDFTWDGMKFFH